jgi:hypothetical protein
MGQFILVGVILLIFYEPMIIPIAIGLWIAYWLVTDKHGHLHAVTFGQKQSRNRRALKHLRAAANRKQNYAESRSSSFRNPIKKRGYVYAFAQKKVFGVNEISDKEDYYRGNAMKIGYTTGDPGTRARELSKEYNTRVFEPAIIAEVNWCYEVEQRVHSILAPKWLWREMFDVTVEEAENAIWGAVKNTEGVELFDIKKITTRSDYFNKGGIYFKTDRPGNAEDIPF